MDKSLKEEKMRGGRREKEHEILYLKRGLNFEV